MTEAHPCLLRKNNTSKYTHFPFLEDQISIGRDNGQTYSILSTAISRSHAIIEKQGDNTWTIKDNKSMNGTSVNGTKLSPLEPHTLRDGDVVQFAVSCNADAPAKFVYTFFSSLKVRREPKRSKAKSPGAAEGGSSKSSSKPVALKNMLTECEENAGRSKKRKAPKTEDDNLEQKRLKMAYESKLHTLTEQLKEKEKEKSAIAQQLQQERQEKQVMKQKQREQEKNVSKLAAKQRQLVEERTAVEARVRQELESRLAEQEEGLREQMLQKLAQLTADKRDVEERLQREMRKAVRDKDQGLQDKLKKENDRLQKVIETKALEQKALESQLAESRQEKERAKADTLTAREAILSEFANTMETELQCSICNELFVKATSLNCSHAFCACACASGWP